ncbi:MAG TPA: DNA internalization-related competence protein ComEC/Rec2, partial [Methylomirabilota bacterium]|nr:DNA internalization-related competence protein ComEC/Rec2 [Methylomirabilota bacterium]
PPVFQDDGAFDRRAYLESQDVHLVATLRAAQLIERESPSARSMRYRMASARARLRRTLDALFPASPESAAILRAMLLGDRSFVDRDASKNFQVTGTYHVLVVAGLHVTAIAVFLFWLGRLLRMPRTIVALASLVALCTYVSVIEERPPVLRAVLMAGIVVVGWILFRRLDLLNSAGLAALLILLFRPLELFDSSFQLSFLAMACIGGIAAPWLDRRIEPYARALKDWRDVTRDLAHEPRQAQFRIDLRAAMGWLARRLPGRLERPGQDAAVRVLSWTFRVAEILALSFVLQAGMLPLMAQEFHRVTLSGPLANLFAVPLTGILVPLGFVTLGAGAILAPAGRFLAHPLAWLTALLLRVVGWLARLPRLSYRIPTPPVAVVLLFLSLLIVMAVMTRLRMRRTYFAAIALLACGLVVAVFPFKPRISPGTLELTALDVGQGDSLLVISARGTSMLIDAGGSFTGWGGGAQRRGPDPGEEAVSPYLWSRGFKKIDILVLTHAHHDHLGGMFAILENFRVGRLWIGREVSSPAQAALEKLAREKHIPIEHEQRGARMDWDNTRLEVLWPEVSPDDPAAPSKNDDSLVLRMTYGERTFLLAGDAEKQAEREMVSESTEKSLRADVLKIGHHGSRNSTTPGFLARVSPGLAVISAGAENSFGHPHAELLERLQGAGVRVLRTDREGAIHILTDGKRIEASCFVPCAAPGNSATSP